MKKYSAAIIAGLIVFSGLALSTFEKRKTDLYAVVNGIEIKGKDFITDENKNNQEKMKEDLDNVIEKKVLETEAKKLNKNELVLLSFFDSPNVENLRPQSKEHMSVAVSEMQYDVARRKYILELKSRSTILLVDDSGAFHPYKISPH